MAQQTAQVTVTGTPENPIFNFVLPTGAKGEPGGWNVGTNLGVGDAARNLNDVTSPGLYYQGDLGTAQRRELNYPPQKDVGGSVRGVLAVKSWSGGTSIVQEYINIGNRGDTTPRPLMVYRRHNNGTEWSQWFTYPAMSIITDTNGFKSVSVWEDTTNAWVPITGPGGQSDPVILDSQVNINTITTSGSYSHGVAVTTTQNYPVSGVAGFLVVKRVNGNLNLVHQEWTPFAHTQGTLNWSRGYYTRMMNSGTWSPWRFIASQRVDDTAGKAIYTWDDVANKEQLIYGDTGVRNIISSISGQSTTAADPSVLLHRYGNLVTLVFENLQPAVSADWSPYLSLPAGFRPRLRNPHRFFVVATNLGEQRSLFLYTSGAMTIFGAKTTDVIRASFTYPTIDPWPTSLPGVAI